VLRQSVRLGNFILPQAIINSSGSSFKKWQMEGFLQGRPGSLSLENGRLLAGASGQSLFVFTIVSFKNVHQALPTGWTLL
jgi:hypothetical protein